MAELFYACTTVCGYEYLAVGLCYQLYCLAFAVKNTRLLFKVRVQNKLTVTFLKTCNPFEELCVLGLIVTSYYYCYKTDYIDRSVTCPHPFLNTRNQTHTLMCLAVSLFALTYRETYFPQLSERQ